MVSFERLLYRLLFHCASSLSTQRTKHRYLGFLLQPDIRRRNRVPPFIENWLFRPLRGLLCTVYRVRFGDIPLSGGFAPLFLLATWQQPLMHSRLQYPAYK